MKVTQRMISFNPTYKKFRFRPKFGRVSGSFLTAKAEINGILTIHIRCIVLEKMKNTISILSFITALVLIASCSNFDSSKKIAIDKSPVTQSTINVAIDLETENRYAFIKEIIESNKDLFIKVDYVDYLTGKEAMDAEWRDEAYFIDGTDTITNITDGYYISNVNPQIRTFKIAIDALIENVIDDNGSHKMQEIKHLNTEQLQKYLDSNTLLFIHIKNGIVERIDERYMP